MTRDEFMKQHSLMRLTDLDYVRFRMALALGPPYEKGAIIAEITKDLTPTEMRRLMVLDDAQMTLEYIILRLQ